MSAVQELADAYLEAVLRLADAEDETMAEVVARAPPCDPVHRLAASTVRCAPCGWIGGLGQTALDLPDCIVCCPRCGEAERLDLLAEGTA